MTRAATGMLALSLGASALLAGCGNYAQSLEQEVSSSLQFDSVPCADLVSRRDALVAVHGDPATLPESEKAGARPSHVLLGLGTVMSDSRAAEVRLRRKALGDIEAMDASIKRRNCRGDGRGSARLTL